MVRQSDTFVIGTLRLDLFAKGINPAHARNMDPKLQDLFITRPLGERSHTVHLEKVWGQNLEGDGMNLSSNTTTMTVPTNHMGFFRGGLESLASRLATSGSQLQW